MKQLYLWLCAGLMMASCTHSELGNEPQGGSGPVSRVAFSAAIKPQYTLNYTSAEGSNVDLDQIQWPGAADFALDILSGGSVVQSHPAGAIPSELELYVGAYSLRAHSGTDTEAWNVPYLEGTQDFSLSSSSTAYNAQLTCGLKSTLVYLVFDQSFSNIFSDYTAYLNTDHTKEAWVWTAGEKRVACMRPTEQLLIRVDVTMRANGNKYNYGINPLVDLKAGELNVVRFSMVGGEVNATISSDNGVKITEKTVQLEADWLATRKTSISATFDPATAFEHIYGLPYTTPTDVVVRSNVGLKSLKLKASGDLATLLGVTEVDLRTANEVESKTGLVLTKAEGAMAYDGRLNFKGCLNTLPVLVGTASAYTFTVEAVDLLGETKTFDTKINISLPELGTRSVDPTKVWNRYAKVPGVPVTDARVPAEFLETFVFEYAIREGDGAWQSIGKHTGTADIYKGALKPATTYTTAVDLGGGRYVAQASFTTDVEPQVPNGDFLQTITRVQGSGIGTYYEPAVWITPNPTTTQNYNGAKTGAQAYPCVKIEDGAAVIATVGYGDNNTIEHSYQLITGANKWRNSSVQYVAAGRLSVTSGTSERPFVGKPQKIRFAYKYIPVAGSWEMKLVLKALDGTVVGECTLGGSAGKSEFGAPIELPIVYDRANFNATPQTMELYFVAQSNPTTGNVTRVEKSQTGGVLSWKISPNSYFEGTKLYVRDIELIYFHDITDQYTFKD